MKKYKDKKTPQEASAIMDDHAKELHISTEEIKKTSLKYCKEVLAKNKVDKDFIKEVDVKNRIHDIRMKSSRSDDEQVEFMEKNIETILEKFKKKSYNVIVKSGDTFKEMVFKLCARIIFIIYFIKRNVIFQITLRDIKQLLSFHSKIMCI